MTVKYTFRVHFMLLGKNDVYEVTGPSCEKISKEAGRWMTAMYGRFEDFKVVHIDGHRDTR